MAEPTPQSNLCKIVELKGHVSTSNAQLQGAMDLLAKSAESMEKSVAGLIEDRKRNDKKISEHISRLYSKSDDHGEKVVVLEEKMENMEKAKEAQQETRQWTIGQIITVMGTIGGWVLALFLFLIG